MVGFLLMGSSGAKPGGVTGGHPPVGPLNAGGTMRDWSKEDLAVRGGNLNEPNPQMAKLALGM